MTIFISNQSFGDSLGVDYKLCMPPLAGGLSKSQNSLQSLPNVGHRFELTGRTGTDYGFLYGAGYGLEQIDYAQMNTSTQTSTAYKAKYNFPYAKIGLWKALDKNLSFDGAVMVSSGKLELKDSAQAAHKSNFRSVGIDLRGRYNIFTVANESKLSLIFGIEVSQPLVKEFAYAGRTFTPADFHTILLFFVGAGFEFDIK